MIDLLLATLLLSFFHMIRYFESEKRDDHELLKRQEGLLTKLKIK